jgi:hypothetical protein
MGRQTAKAQRMTRSPSESDAWVNVAAKSLLTELEERGIVVKRLGSLLDVRPASRLTSTDKRLLHEHKWDLLLLVLVLDERTLDRLLALKAGRMPAGGEHAEDGACHTCRAPLPAGRRRGRCVFCAIAARLAFGAPLTNDLLALLPDDAVRRQAP